MILQIDNLHVNYGLVRVLKGINFTVKEKGIVALLGPNGAGKSTTVKAISGLIPILEGSINYFGETINGIPPERRVDKGIVQIPEGRLIFHDLTVKENLLMGAFRRKSKKECLMDLNNIIGYFPNLKLRMRQKGGTLSGGEQQILAFARGLMARPRLLLMDEPSLGLAPMITRNIFDVITKINEDGVSILLVEQNAKMALQISHFAYILELGQVSLEGSGPDLMKEETVKNLYFIKNQDR